jgi:Rap1a immunity proteins
MRLQGGRIRRLKRLKRKPMSRTFTAIAGLAALIALSASAATADENPYSANSMLPACKAVLAISSGNPAAGIDPVEMGIGMIEGVALLANHGVFCPPAGAIIKQRIQVIIAYIEARPQRMREDFRVLAVEAMQKAWPCKN